MQSTERNLALSRIEKKGHTAYDSLSEPERVWFTITRLIFCIRDGGLDSYFYNGYSQHAVDCMRSLEILGAAKMRDRVRRMHRMDWQRRPGFFVVLRELFRSWTGIEDRETEWQLQEATRLEEKLDEYVTQQRIA